MSDCGCKDALKNPGADSCAPAELCRNNYYTGKLLTARDFRMEQDYFRDKLRLHHLALHGWGIVCGLELTPHENEECHRIRLHPGLAIDTCGLEIRVLQSRDFDLPKPPDRPKKKPCDDNEHKYDDDNGRHPEDKDDEDCKDRPDPIDLYFCIAYKECEEEFGPAPFDDCNCNGATQQAGRICESYELCLLTEKPEWWDKVIPDKCPDEDCTVIWKEGRKCKLPPAYPCIPLAVIYGWLPDQKLKQEQIGDVGSKLSLPSTTLIKQVIDCILDRLPLKDYTVIDHFNWTHGQNYSCDDFMRIFVGEKERESFDITFSRPLHKDGVSKRSFQLMVVYRDKPSMPREIHIVPEEIRLSDDRKTVHIEIDSAYAQRHLDRRRFDLYIRVYCDKLIDDAGDPVDGNLLARKTPDDEYVVAPPTGNGAPGGIFDSWILVR